MIFDNAKRFAIEVDGGIDQSNNKSKSVRQRYARIIKSEKKLISPFE